MSSVKRHRDQASSPAPVPGPKPGPALEPATRAGFGGIVAELAATHGRRLQRILRRKLQNPEDAQDAAQEVFLKLWKREREGALRAEADAYLHTAANSVVIDLHRRRKAHAADRHLELDTLDDADLPAAVGGADESAYWREGLALLVDSIGKLPELTQQVFILYHFNGMDHNEIARRLGVSLRSVERHMAHALRHCKDCLGDFLDV
ncbi:RNA polymerase sigma factor [Denitratisoma sp. DHT3]|uniref:RNA polymerase sigma factor n=1 Tax=Denitratisoma sp. DHT3 TaxID=1981880 RepID=UPI0016472D7A|nr:sigma-70 family RNA polymerase sigma factor [Denitratisoma sp. DHT3]